MTNKTLILFSVLETLTYIPYIPNILMSFKCSAQFLLNLSCTVKLSAVLVLRLRHVQFLPLEIQDVTGDFFPLQNVIDRKPYPEDEGLVEVKFARTPVMSTYLVAFVIGEYDFVESRSSDGITVRVYTPLGKAEQGKFALEVSVSFMFSVLLL